MNFLQFQNAKKSTLEKKDKSDIGKYDDKIRKLCEKINKKKEYYTTSSCSGRIVLILGEDKKKEGLFLYRTHNKVTLGRLKKELESTCKRTKKTIYFKQEPFILHLCCFNLDSAKRIMNIAQNAGVKQKGILSLGNKIIIEMKGSEKIELPILKNGKMLLNDYYLKILLQESNKKLERTWKKIQNLSELL
jgi:tRNA wybutosine-synthesizing protein 3